MSFPSVRINSRNPESLGKLKDLYLYVKSGDIAKVQIFLENYHDNLNINDESGDTLITKVLQSDEIKSEVAKLSLIRMLQNSGADVNMVHSVTLQSPLHMAVCRKYIRIVKFLICEGQSVMDDRDFLQKEPIHYIVNCDIDTNYSAYEIVHDSSFLKLLQIDDDKYLLDNIRDDINNLLDKILGWLNNSAVFQLLKNHITHLHNAPWFSLFNSDINVEAQLEEIESDIHLDESQKKNKVLTKFGETYNVLVEGIEYNAFVKNNILANFESWHVIGNNNLYKNYPEVRWKYLKSIHEAIVEDLQSNNTTSFMENLRLTLLDFIGVYTNVDEYTLPFEEIRTCIALGSRGQLTDGYIHLLNLPEHEKAFLRMDRAMTHRCAILTRGHVLDFENKLFIRGHTYLAPPTSQTRDPIEATNVEEFLSILLGIDQLVVSNTYVNNRIMNPVGIRWHRWGLAIVILVKQFPVNRDDCLLNLYEDAGFAINDEDRYLKNVLASCYERKDLDWQTIFWVVLSVLWRTMEYVKGIDNQVKRNLLLHYFSIHTCPLEFLSAVHNAPGPPPPDQQIMDPFYLQEIRTSLTWSFHPRLVTLLNYMTKADNSDFRTFIKPIRRWRSISTRQIISIEYIRKILKISETSHDRFDVQKPEIKNLLDKYKIENPDIFQKHKCAEWVYLMALKSDDPHRIKSAIFDVEEMLQRVFLDRVQNSLPYIDYLGDLQTLLVLNAPFNTDRLDRIVLILIAIYLGGFWKMYRQLTTNIRNILVDQNANKYNRIVTTVLNTMSDDQKVMIAAFSDAVFEEKGKLGTTILPRCSQYLKEVVQMAFKLTNDPETIIRMVWQSYGVHPDAVRILNRVVSDYKKNQDKNAYIRCFSFVQTFYAVSYAELLGLQYGGETIQIPSRITSPLKHFIIGDQNNENNQVRYAPPPLGVYDQLLGPVGYELWFEINDITKADRMMNIVHRPSRIDCVVTALSHDISTRLEKMCKLLHTLQHMINDHQNTIYVQILISVSLHNELLDLKKLSKVYLKSFSGMAEAFVNVIDILDKTILLSDSKATDSYNILAFLNNEIKYKISNNKLSELVATIGKVDEPNTTHRTDFRNVITTYIIEDYGGIAQYIQHVIRLYQLSSGIQHIVDAPINIYNTLPPYQITDTCMLNFVNNQLGNDYSSPYLEVVNDTRYMDVLSSGNTLLSVWKEDALHKIMSYFDSPEHAKYYVIEHIITRYLLQLLRGEVLKVCLDMYELEPSAIKNPSKFFIPTELNHKDLESIYSKWYLTDNKIVYKLPWDYFRRVEFWEYDTRHYVYGNSTIQVLINTFRDFILEEDDQQMTIIHHLVETCNYELLMIYRRHVKRVGSESLSKFAEERFDLHCRLFDANRLSVIIENIVEPCYRETCAIMATEKFAYAILTDLHEGYRTYATTVVKFILKFDVEFNEEKKEELDEIRCNTFVSDFVMDEEYILKTFYEISSENCILKKTSSFYTEVYQLILSFMKSYWTPNLIKTVDIRLDSNPQLEGIESELCKVVLGLPRPQNSDEISDLELLMSSIKERLFNTNPHLDKEILDKVLEYYSDIANNMLLDLRSIATNLMRFFINQALLLKTREVLITPP